MSRSCLMLMKPRSTAFLSCRRMLSTSRIQLRNDTTTTTSSTDGAGPLEGLRVLDLTRVLGKTIHGMSVKNNNVSYTSLYHTAGPYCTMMLGDLG